MGVKLVAAAIVEAGVMWCSDGIAEAPGCSLWLQLMHCGDRDWLEKENLSNGGGCAGEVDNKDDNNRLVEPSSELMSVVIYYYSRGS